MNQMTNLEIIVLTYNRANYLREALTSIVNQTVFPGKITVLNNASTDDTVSVINEFKRHNVYEISHLQNIGPEGNYKFAKEMASLEWVMIFHDDDLLHPRYIEYVNVLLTKHASVSVVATLYKEFDNLHNPWWQVSGKYMYISVNDLAGFLFKGIMFHYGATIYKTKYLKETEIRADIYGKISDRPFVLDCAINEPRVLLLTEPYVQYRRHSDQDVSNSENGPFINELLALNEKYMKVCGTNIFERSGRAYLTNLFWNLHQYYVWASDRRNISERSFFLKAIRKLKGGVFFLIMGGIYKLRFIKFLYHKLIRL